MVIGCYLVQSGLCNNGDEALQFIAKEWRTVAKCTRYPHSPETGKPNINPVSILPEITLHTCARPYHDPVLIVIFSPFSRSAVRIRSQFRTSYYRLTIPFPF
jgi:hypothetical protein